MHWKFWQKKNETGEAKAIKLPRPKELPSGVGRFIVVNLKQDPDWVWNLKSVSIPKEGSKTLMDVRVFSVNEANEKGVTIRDYTSLDIHPDLVLFDGWYDKNTLKVQMRDCRIQETAA